MSEKLRFPKAKKGVEVAELLQRAYWGNNNSSLKEVLHQCLDGKFVVDKELVEQLESLMLPHILEGIAELVDDRSDFRKGYQVGYVDAIKKVLEAVK